MMVVTLIIAMGVKQGWMADFGRVPAVAVAIVTGACGVLLVFTDMMVRAMYMQTAKMAQLQAEAESLEALQADGQDKAPQ